MKGLIRKETGIFVLLVVLCLVTALKEPRFLSAQNLVNTSRLIGLYGIFSIGAGLVIITGGIDLSVGSMFALLGVLLAMWLSEKHWSPMLAIAAVLALGTALGTFHAFLITKLRMQPFIVTLCGLLFYRGMARFIANDETKGFGGAQGFESLQKFATGSLFGLPMPVVILLVVSLIMGVLLHRSVWGRHLFAAGRNEEAARYSGINTVRVIGSTYVIGGFLAAIAGILIAFYTNSISPSGHGNFYELYGIAAAVLGGCSLRGGEGSIVGILLGTILLQVLRNLVIFLNIPSSLEFAVIGAVILIGVLADQTLSRRAALRRTT
ncbi:ABC transporter permease [Fimbriimonas ginsengisoli]|uniref:Ribose ABC superfamily ATP binding cassette transporter, membrane protein n=1 Tax=Fimbriimonas ginsengisoli Gsoil 348 TaxID=661478 RepID=A0A068NMQ3_FIMGI|nr:ABC transporter permease [Fimbriimonas ginsengisoli]AIE84667.1 ribose ABC superfamily ATP binding cassette transporter, membrane protein [Fimbriimonas ginsengisoli Gsoil 348]